MYQSMVEGRYVPWSLLVKDMPQGQAPGPRLHRGPARLGRQRGPNFKDNHYLEPVVAATRASEGFVDRWIVYGKIDGEQLFTAKELTVKPGAKVHHQGHRRLRPDHRAGQRPRSASSTVQTPAMIRFGEMTEDEVFVTHEAAEPRA